MGVFGLLCDLVVLDRHILCAVDSQNLVDVWCQGLIEQDISNEVPKGICLNISSLV